MTQSVVYDMRQSPSYQYGQAVMCGCVVQRPSLKVVERYDFA